MPNISTVGLTPKITAKWHPRRGRECVIPTVKKTASPDVKRLFYASLPVHGQQLFNTLPTDIRSITRCSVDCFKRKLDEYLWTVPDEPQIPSYTAQRRADSNSLVDMSRYASMPTTSLWWKCQGTPSQMVTKVVLTALPWHSDVRRFNKVTR